MQFSFPVACAANPTTAFHMRHTIWGMLAKDSSYIRLIAGKCRNVLEAVVDCPGGQVSQEIKLSWQDECGDCAPHPVVDTITQALIFDLYERYLRFERPETCGFPSGKRILIIQFSQCRVADIGLMRVHFSIAAVIRSPEQRMWLIERFIY